MHAIVNSRKLDDEGKAVGNMNNNPLLDNISYEVDFSDGTNEVISANIIYDNILAQVDEYGHRQIILNEIIYHI